MHGIYWDYVLLAIVDIKDPNYPFYVHIQKGLIIRTNIPAGFDIKYVDVNNDWCHEERIIIHHDCD